MFGVGEACNSLDERTVADSYKVDGVLPAGNQLGEIAGSLIGNDLECSDQLLREVIQMKMEELKSRERN